MDLSNLAPAQRVLADIIIEKCVTSRMYFIKEILGVDFIEDWQEEHEEKKEILDHKLKEYPE